MANRSAGEAYTGAPVAWAMAPAPPTWSGCRWVTTMAARGGG
jgi:hypothetical protein